MKVVIDIPDFMYNGIRNGTEGKGIIECNAKAMADAIYYGTPLPKGHGDLVDRDKVLDLLNEQEYNYYTELDKVCDTVYEVNAIIEADEGKVER